MTAIIAGALLAGGLGGRVALACQGHMVEARRMLLAARHQFEIAAPNKAGHRIDAIRAVDAAINQVSLAIRAGYR